MQIAHTPLKPLSTIQLTPEENTILKWLRSTPWEEVKGDTGAISYKTKVPQFYGGARLYALQAGGPGVLELFIKKLGFLGIIDKQELYPVAGIGNQPRFLSLKKADLDNLGVGRGDDEDDE